MKISLSTHLFVFYILNEKLVSFIRENGFDKVEIWGMRPHFDYYDRDYLRKIKRALRRNGIEVTSFHAPMYRFVGDASKGLWLKLSDTVENNRRAAVEETINLMKVAVDFEPFNFVIHPDLSPENFDQTLSNLRKSLDELIVHARDFEIKLAIETGIRNSNISASIVEIVNQLDEDIFGICVDVGHANVGEDPVSALKRSMHRLIEVHVSDNDGEGDTHLVPGDGNMKWDEIINHLKGNKFKGNFVLEIMDPVRDSSRPLIEFLPVIKKLNEFRLKYEI